MKIKRVLDKLLYVPFDDVVVAQRAKSLLGMLLFMGFADGLVVLRAAVLEPNLPFFFISLTILLVFIGLYWFTRRGHRWTNYVFLACLTAAIPYAFWQSLDTPAVLAFAIPIVAVPLVARSELAIPFALIEIVILFFLSMSVSVDFDVMGIILVLSLGVISWLSNSGLEKILRTSRQNAEALELANRELEDGRILLEQHSEELERRADYLQTTTNVARDVASELALHELLDRVVHLVSERFDFYHVGIFLLDEAGEWADLQAASGAGGQQMLARGYRVQVGGTTAVGDVTDKGLAHISLDVDDDGTFQRNPNLPETHSVITLPLRARGRIIGALDVQSRQVGAFSQDDMSVLQALADQVALAIGNARLFEQLQASLEAQRQFYGELSRDAWATVLEERPDLGYRSNAYGVAKIPTEVQQPDVSVALQKGTFVEGANSEDGGRNTIAVPIKSPGGQIIGVIDTYKSAVSGAWTVDEKALLQEVSARLGDALESAQFYYETQRRATREQLTREITEEMRRSINIETILQTAVSSLGKALGAPHTYIRLMLDDDQTTLNTEELSTQLPEIGDPEQGDERSES